LPEVQLKISVITPVYNRSSTIARALDSLLAQTYRNFEVLLVDDGSSDNSTQIIEPYLQDNRFRLICLPQNSGVNKARNIGLANISDDSAWVTFLDSDDEFVPDALGSMAEAVADSTGIDDFCFAVAYVDGTSGSKLQSNLRDYDVASLLDAKLRPLGEWVHLIRAELVRQNKFVYETNIRNGFESIAYLRLAQYTPVRYLQTVVRRYHLDVEGLTRIRHKTAAKALDEIHGYSSFLTEFGPLLKQRNRAEYVLMNCVLAKTYLEVGEVWCGFAITCQMMWLRPAELRIYRNFLLLAPVLLLKIFNRKLVRAC